MKFLSKVCNLKHKVRHHYMLIFEYFSVECIYFFLFFTKLKFMLISLWLQINFNIVSTHYTHIIYKYRHKYYSYLLMVSAKTK